MSPADIRSLRAHLDLTQQQFASLLGLSFVSVNRWEGDHSAPTGLSLVLLQLVSGAARRVSPNELVRLLRETGPDPMQIIRTLVPLEGGGDASLRS